MKPVSESKKLASDLDYCDKLYVIRLRSKHFWHCNIGFETNSDGKQYCPVVLHLGLAFKKGNSRPHAPRQQ